MLSVIGVGREDDLLMDIPAALRARARPELPPACTELELQRLFAAWAAENRPAGSMLSLLGAGAYDHAIPSVVGQLIGRSEFYTAYTPYQAEMSQGLLQAIYEYQTMICELTAMDVANASVYDGASALAEAALMAAAQVIGNDTTITIAGQSGNFQLNVMLPVIAYNLLESIGLLANALRALADHAIAGFSVNEERIAAALDRNPILVTALNPVIGYEKGAEIARRAYAEGRPILDVAAEMTDLPRAELARLLDPRDLTRGGIKGGGSGGG